ncbi:MAG: fibronectin type III domain-containing protein, partial [Defluviitaleaceae bacterium]|nr:fibronectin type III domain-containing protein [Defluviitaleaceae bacterium]
YWDVTYRIFIGNNAEISRIAQLRAEQRTTAIVYAVAGTVVPSNILGIRHIDYMEPPVASGHELEVNGDNDQDIFDLSPWIEYLRGDPPTTAPRAIVLEVPLRVPHDFPLVDFLQTFRFEGLDYNWPYYVFVDSFIQFVDENGDPPAVQTPPSREYSNNTDVRGIITRTDLIEPDPGEIIPTAPRDLRVESVASTRANISWLDVARPADIPGARIEFEIVRMRAGQVLPESLLNRRDQNLAQFVYAMSPEAQANFEAATRTNRVMGADGQMVLTLINPDPAIPGMSATAYNDFTLMHSPGGRVELENTGLAPNTLYFYYVRTVWITPQGEMFSTWNGISVTTTIVEPPVNLRIVDGRAFPEANLNPENQIVIRFEANVGSVEGGTGNVQNDHGSEFDFRFSLRADGGDWTAPVFLPSEMNGSGTHRLLERVPTQGMPGYYTFTYVISGLDPGTTYSVRVHTFDIQNSAGGGAFDEVYSEWSNIATTRTDADQEFFNRERERENMRQYLRDLLMEFVRRPYWISRDFGNLFAGLYRPSMINYLLDTNSNMVRLTATDNDVNVFYLPQPLFLAMWDSGQGFVVQRDGMEITIPNQAINNINSQPVIQAVQRIRDVGGVNDYYIRLSVDMRTPANQHVNGLPVKGSQVSLTVELVESSVLTRQLDQDILRRIMYLIETDHFIDNLIPGRTVTFAQEIDNLVARGAPWPERVRRLYEMRDIIFQEMSNEVSSRLHPTRGRTTTFNYFDQAISIGINNIGGSTAVSGFQLAGQNNWASLNVRQQGTNRVMSTQVPGIFAFGGQILVLPGLNTIPNHDTLQALIVRYGLTDFLGVDATFNVNNPISLSAVQGVAARLAGAPAAASPQNWLRGRGYIIPVRGAGAPAQTQEVVYTIMALYEIRTGTRVSALRITNFAALNGISGIDARYRPFIQAAFQLGIYNNANMQPTATMTVGEFLRLIAALDQRVGF